MQFLKTLFWVLLAVIAVLFSLRNWTPVSVGLWDNLVLETRLPVLLFGAFLLGLLPTFLLHRATKWSLKRRLETMERVIADQRPAPTSTGTIQPAAAPIAAPPGVA
jgi:lipopolysaccharide assembly protein A